MVSSTIAFLDFDSVSSGRGEDDLRKVFEGKCVCVCYEKVVTQGWRDKLGLERNEAPARMLDAGLFSRFVVENRFTGETVLVVVANNVIFGRREQFGDEVSDNSKNNEPAFSQCGFLNCCSVKKEESER